MLGNGQSTNGLADSLAKQGVDGTLPLAAFTLWCFHFLLVQCFYTIVLQSLIGFVSPFVIFLFNIIFSYQWKKRKSGHFQTLLRPLFSFPHLLKHLWGWWILRIDCNAIFCLNWQKLWKKFKIGQRMGQLRRVHCRLPWRAAKKQWSKAAWIFYW